MVASYRSGDTVNDVAEQFSVHRTTVMTHLKRRGRKRPEATATNYDDGTLAAAARLYANGAFLAEVGAGSASTPRPSSTSR